MNRTLAPEFKQADKIDLVIPQKIVLDNDISLYWLKDVKDDSVRLDIEWFAGTKYQTKKLVAGFTNKLLLSGNEKKSAREIAAEIDFYGGFVQDECDKDHSGVTLYGLKENFKNIFSVFSEAMLTCTFPEKDFEDERNITLSKFKIDSEKVKYLCQRTFNAALFGENTPYGQMALEPDFLALNRNDLMEFHKKFYIGSKPVLFLLGNVGEDVIDEIRNWTSQLSGQKSTPVKQQIVSKTGRTEIEKKDAIQTAIRIGRTCIDKKHPDYFGLQILDTILGGYFGSRLMANIREDKGYTYGIGSAFAVMDDAAYFFISTEVAKEVKENTITEIYFELDRLKNELIPEDELERVKNYMLGEFLRQMDGPGAMMESFKNIWFNQLSQDYYSRFIHAINNYTAAELRDLAKKYYLRERMVEVVVG